MDQENRLFPGKRISGDGNLLYAALHPFPLPGWISPDRIHLKGPNWQVIFKLDGANYLDAERGGGVVDRHLDGPNVLISGAEGYSDPVEATRDQKPIVDAIRGLLLLGAPPARTILLPAVWEGVMAIPSPGRVAFEVHRVEATAIQVTPSQLHGWGKRWESFNPVSTKKELGFALRWYYKGMVGLHDRTGDGIDAFISLWICIITLVRAWHAQNIGGDPRESDRFSDYAEKRLLLTGSDLDDARGQFRVVLQRRNELFKGGGGMAVSQGELLAAELLSHRILDLES